MPMPQLGTMMPIKEREESIPSLQRTLIANAERLFSEGISVR